MTTGPLTIPLSKGKQFVGLCGAICFVALGAWMWTYADEQTRYRPTYVIAVAGTCVVFFSIAAVCILMKIFDNRPGLILDPQEIVDNSSAVPAGRIAWSDIRGFSISDVHRQSLLAILVHDPDKYTVHGTFIRRHIARANLRMYGSPIQISSNSLKITFDDLVATITAHYEKRKNA